MEPEKMTWLSLEETADLVNILVSSMLDHLKECDQETHDGCEIGFAVSAQTSQPPLY